MELGIGSEFGVANRPRRLVIERRADDIVADQRLNAYRFRRAEDAIPARSVLAATDGGGNEDRAGTRVNTLKQDGEILAAHFSGKLEARRAPADPAPDAPLILCVIIVLAVVVLEVVLRLRGIERVV